MTRPLVEFKVSVPDTPDARRWLNGLQAQRALEIVLLRWCALEGVTVTEIAPEPGEEKRDGPQMQII